VKAALKFDWRANSKDLARAWQDGGTLKITKIHPDPATGKYDYLGTKGQKIEWEMVPMGELFVEEGTLPGDDPFALSGADGTIWYLTGRWAATVVRLCGGIAILDAEHNFDPVTFVQFNKDSQDHYEVVSEASAASKISEGSQPAMASWPATSSLQSASSLPSAFGSIESTP
jgi:thiocyanate desulfurase